MKLGIAAATALIVGQATTALAAAASNSTGLEKIKYFVYFMQENRAFDHYYGTMAGVRGFNDPNVGIQENGNNLYYQPDPKSTDVKNGTKYLLPFQFTGNRAGCTLGGSNAWVPFHAAINNGSNNDWPSGNSPMSMGYEVRDQIPYHFALAESFTIADMYFQSIAGSTSPNRITWISGTNGADGRYMQDNTEEPTYSWSSYPQNLTKAGVSWQVFQDNDNFDDDPLKWFTYWNDLPDGSAEKSKALGFLGIKEYKARAANGTLPQVSYIVGATELSEHPDNCPMAGAWLQQEIVNATMHSPLWNETALIINYDETGGFYDHVIPPQAPKSEWQPAYLEGGALRSPGLGPRVPLVCVSPYCRGGNVYTELADHRSTLMLLEEWIGKYANGTVRAPAELISPWARSTVSKLINLFDFENPDFSIPKLPVVAEPPKNPTTGAWDPTEMCEKLTDPKSTPPYGNQTMPVVEKGSKRIRGSLTEGRYLVFRSGSQSLQSSKSSVVVGKSTLKKAQEVFVVKQVGKDYHIVDSASNRCISANGNGLTLGACGTTAWSITYNNHGATYAIADSKTGKSLSLSGSKVALATKGTQFQIYSVSI